MPSATPRLPCGRILELADDILGLLPGFHARHHDAPGARRPEPATKAHTPSREPARWGTISLPRHDATISASRAISQRPCSMSKITKSSPHAASMCPMPGVKSSSTIWPKKNIALAEPLAKHGHQDPPSAANAALYCASFSRNPGLLSTCGLTTCCGASPR